MGVSVTDPRIIEARRVIRDRTVDGVQRRSVPLVGLEVRDSDDGAYAIKGHGAVFHDLSENLGGFRERIDPGAFATVLADRKLDVRALYNHDPNLVLARTTNGTLRLKEDGTGLLYEADVAPTSYGRDLRVLLERGDVTQSSFAFRVARGGESWDEDEETGVLIRTITEFSGLYDVSPVTYPAYPTADSGLSSSPTDAERNGDGPSVGERAEDGGKVDGQAEQGGYRLALRKRRLPASVRD